MKKISAYVGICPDCQWEFLEPNPTRIEHTLRLHLSAIHRHYPAEIDIIIDRLRTRADLQAKQ